MGGNDIRVAWASVAALLCACSSSSAAKVPFFDDVTSAPPEIQSAADAVVLVQIPGGFATASFISPDGLLLTNNHVLGVGVCPIEGCYAQISWNFQRGAPVPKPMTVFVVPKAVDTGLDMAVLQASTNPGGPSLQTPNYLTIDARDPNELEGTHVNLVGHPEASIKKWTSGEVVYSDGSWVWTTAFDLPGSSGSPILDDHGHLVGIVHRGPTDLTLATNEGINGFSVGTASAALVAAFPNPLPAAMTSTAVSVTDDQAVNRQRVYLAAHDEMPKIDGSPKPVLESLGAACDAALAVTDYASPDDVSTGLQPCFDAEDWIDCRSDKTATYAVCPVDIGTWQMRYEGVFEYWRRFNGQLNLDEMSFAEAALSSDMMSGRAAGAQLLVTALSEAHPALDFHVAQHLAAFQIPTYDGTPVVDFARNYVDVPDYELNGEDIVSTILWLGNLGGMDPSEVKSLLYALHSDPKIDVGTKLFIEAAEYYRGILP
jgi:hypothetical protein